MGIQYRTELIGSLFNAETEPAHQEEAAWYL